MSRPQFDNLRGGIMAAVFGVVNLYGLAPATGHAQESSKDAGIEIATIRDANGVTVMAKPKKLVTKNITISGKGTVNFSDVATGTITKGTAFVTSVKVTENQDDFPSFEIQAVIYDDLA